MITPVTVLLERQFMGVDEKSKQQVDSKQTYVTSYAPIESPSNSMFSVLNLPSRPVTGHHMSPGRSLPTGMANTDKSEVMPEIQMPSMATMDPFFRGTTEQDYASTTSHCSMLIQIFKLLLQMILYKYTVECNTVLNYVASISGHLFSEVMIIQRTMSIVGKYILSHRGQDGHMIMRIILGWI